MYFFIKLKINYEKSICFVYCTKIKDYVVKFHWLKNGHHHRVSSVRISFAINRSNPNLDSPNLHTYFHTHNSSIDILVVEDYFYFRILHQPFDVQYQNSCYKQVNIIDSPTYPHAILSIINCSQDPTIPQYLVSKSILSHLQEYSFARYPRHNYKNYSTVNRSSLFSNQLLSH